ncbi:MAG: hypothetical protein P1U57_09550 [Oleibacter sp.]|nr:hypothetical protein [Thalassolituus sp.]
MKIAKIVIASAFIISGSMLSGCYFNNDSKGGGNVVTDGGNNETPNGDGNTVLLTDLIDNIFQQDRDSEPVAIEGLDIDDNSDEVSFNYLVVQ